MNLLIGTTLKTKIMKTIMSKQIGKILFILLFTPLLIQAQEIDNSFNKTPQEMHDMFMQKHKSKTTAGSITLGLGLAMAGVGFAIIDEDYGIPGAGLILNGGIATLVSVPLFISAGSNKRKAKLALKSEKVSVGMIDKSNNLSLSITIPF